MTFDFDKEKNEILKRERNISFDEVIYAIENGSLISVENNPNYENQKMYIVNINNYAYVVPFVESGDCVFLKTIYASRKYNKEFL